jgi:hypothetical protein
MTGLPRPSRDYAGPPLAAPSFVLAPTLRARHVDPRRGTGVAWRLSGQPAHEDGLSPDTSREGEPDGSHPSPDPPLTASATSTPCTASACSAVTTAMMPARFTTTPGCLGTFRGPLRPVRVIFGLRGRRHRRRGRLHRRRARYPGLRGTAGAQMVALSAHPLSGPPPSLPPQQWTPDQYVAHMIHHPWRIPGELAVRYPSHLHINLLSRRQSSGHGSQLTKTLLAALRDRGSPGSAPAPPPRQPARPGSTGTSASPNCWPPAPNSWLPTCTFSPWISATPPNAAAR